MSLVSAAQGKSALRGYVVESPQRRLRRRGFKRFVKVIKKVVKVAKKLAPLAKIACPACAVAMSKYKGIAKAKAIASTFYD